MVDKNSKHVNNRKMYPKAVAAICIGVILILMTACGGENPGDGSGSSVESKGKRTVSVVVTIQPAADWTENIIGDADGVKVNCLLSGGTDIHSYQPSVKDATAIKDCDLFIFTGGESEEWAEDLLKENPKDGRIVVNLTEILGNKAMTEETVEGMKEKEGEEEEEEEPEIDEHVWLSVRNAKLFCDEISKALGELDPDRADKYRENCRAYTKELKKIDDDYDKAVDNAERKTVLLAGRFPFRYLFEDYGLDYYAAFPGCSSETDASFKTIEFLAGKLKELGLPAVAIVDESERKTGEAIIKASGEKNVKILYLDSMQGDMKKSYIEITRDNLNSLEKALK